MGGILIIKWAAKRAIGCRNVFAHCQKMAPSVSRGRSWRASRTYLYNCQNSSESAHGIPKCTQCENERRRKTARERRRRCLMRQSRTRASPSCQSPRSVADVPFDAGRLTSDGGLAWIALVDAALGLCTTLAGQIPDWRRGAVQHPLETLVRKPRLTRKWSRLVRHLPYAFNPSALLRSRCGENFPIILP
jgi:hypothetical protein